MLNRLFKNLMLVIIASFASIPFGQQSYALDQREIDERNTAEADLLCKSISKSFESGSIAEAESQIQKLQSILILLPKYSHEINYGISGTRSQLLKLRKLDAVKKLDNCIFILFDRGGPFEGFGNQAAQYTYECPDFGESGNFFPVQAEQMYLDWIRFNENKYGKNSQRTAEALLFYANYMINCEEAVYIRSKRRIEEAKAPIDRAIKILRNATDLEPRYLWQRLRELADAYSRDDYEMETPTSYSEDLYKAIFEISHKFKSGLKEGNAPIKVAQLPAMFELANMYRVQERTDEMEKLLLEILECRLRHFPVQNQSQELAAGIPPELTFSILDTRRDTRQLVMTLKKAGKIENASHFLSLMSFENPQSTWRPGKNDIDPLLELHLSRFLIDHGDVKKGLLYQKRVVTIFRLRTDKTSKYRDALQEYARHLKKVGRMDEAARIDTEAKAWEQRNR